MTLTSILFHVLKLSYMCLTQNYLAKKSWQKSIHSEFASLSFTAAVVVRMTHSQYFTVFGEVGLDSFLCFSSCDVKFFRLSDTLKKQKKLFFSTLEGLEGVLKQVKVLLGLLLHFTY